MDEIAIKVEELTKEYRLGSIGYGTMREDLQTWWARLRGKNDPNSLITTSNHYESAKKHFFALDNLNFEIKKGDRVGIIGSNGAGKSTLLKILSRITSPSDGNVYINGKIGSLLEVGTGFHHELTGRENIYLNGSIIGMSRADINKKLDEIVDFSGISKFIDTPVKRYSSGMFVRLGFAVAAHLEPEILIVDEVLAVGDRDFQKKAIDKLHELSLNEGRTILFVSHNTNMLKRLCNTGLLLNSGSLMFTGNIEDTLIKYTNIPTDDIYTQDFRSKIKINEIGITIMRISINKDNHGFVEPFDDMNIEITLEANESISGLGFLITISSENSNEVLFYSNSKHTKGKTIDLVKGVNKIHCSIPSFPFCSENYSLGFGINLPWVKWYYLNNRVFSFHVEKIIPVDSELPSTMEYGRCLVRHEWSHS